MGVIWLCGVRPAGYTRTLIFYVLTIHFFTPAEQLPNKNNISAERLRLRKALCNARFNQLIVESEKTRSDSVTVRESINDLTMQISPERCEDFASDGVSISV